MIGLDDVELGSSLFGDVWLPGFGELGLEVVRVVVFAGVVTLFVVVYVDFDCFEIG